MDIPFPQDEGRLYDLRLRGEGRRCDTQSQNALIFIIAHNMAKNADKYQPYTQQLTLR